MVAIVGFVVLTTTLFAGSLRSYVPVTLTSDRSGLVMETRRQGQAARRAGRPGRPGHRRSATDVSLELEIDPDQIKYIPANVEAQIRATTAVRREVRRPGLPERPSPQRLAAGAVLQVRQRQHRGQHGVPERRRPARPGRPGQAECGAVRAGRGVRGQGETIGQATTDANQVLLGSQPAQRHHQRRLAGVQGIQRHLRRGRPDILTDARRGQHHQHHHHRQRGDAGCACSTEWSVSHAAASTCSARARPT